MSTNFYYQVFVRQDWLSPGVGTLLSLKTHHVLFPRDYIHFHPHRGFFLRSPQISRTMTGENIKVVVELHLSRHNLIESYSQFRGNL